MIRLAIFNRHFSRQAGGAEGYSVAVAESLAGARTADGMPEFEVHVFAQRINHSNPNIIYHKIPGPLQRPRWVNQLFFAICTWWKTKRGFDVIHSHENTWHGHVQTVHVRPLRYNLFFPNHTALTGGRLALRWLKVCTSPRLAVYVWLEAARMRRPWVVTVSEETQRQTLLAYPHLHAQNVPIILPGVNAPNRMLAPSQARANLGLPIDKVLILFVGNDYARKGLSALLAAMPHLAADYHLLCVGSAAQIPHFQRLAAQHGISQRVHFAGALSDISMAYRSADLLVHPTLEDAFAMVVLEAMSYGLPTVVSSKKYCGISAFLKHGQNAWILDDPQDALNIAAAIETVLSPALRTQLTQSGLQFAENYPWERAATAYTGIYRKIF